MAFADQAQLARFSGFQDRVEVAMVTAATQVASEAASDNPQTDQLRKVLATNVLNNPDDYRTRFAWAVVSNPVITFESSDNDIQFTVNSVWNDLAGA